jgi:hypothetical protein
MGDNRKGTIESKSIDLASNMQNEPANVNTAVYLFLPTELSRQFRIGVSDAACHSTNSDRVICLSDERALVPPERTSLIHIST